MDSKKRSVGASERDRWLRAAWQALIAGQIDAERFVFVDEMGSNTSLFSLYAWAPRGERARCLVPRNRGKNTTLLASMTIKGMGPCVAVVGATTRVVFETFVERLLAPTLSPGQVVVMDNLGAHKGERVRELIQERGCELLYLPPYSPDLNPIEEAFSKVKALLRRTGARTREALIEAMGRALGAVTDEDARGFFEHRGYRLPAQSL
ncbi:MAG: IS630 family transposase [Actinobacteria bacterium]|nr:IS630 family transposase [Actinomycetota bacterium]